MVNHMHGKVQIWRRSFWWEFQKIWSCECARALCLCLKFSLHLLLVILANSF